MDRNKANETIREERREMISKHCPLVKSPCNEFCICFDRGSIKFEEGLGLYGIKSPKCTNVLISGEINTFVHQV